MRKNSNQGKSYRQQKVATLIHEALVDILRRGKMLDECLMNCPLTITRVKVSADLKIADCYFIPFNTSLTNQRINEGLNNSKYSIRNSVTEKINMKYSPEIRFHYDKGFDNASKVTELLKQVENSGQDEREC
jgi:ribosome-binding factor A